MNKLELAKWLHDNYEEVARKENWNTQENCKVEFDTLPDANKRTMIKMAERLLNFDLLHFHIVSNCANDKLKQELRNRKNRRKHDMFG
jgi:hypothetical protein